MEHTVTVVERVDCGESTVLAVFEDDAQANIYRQTLNDALSQRDTSSYAYASKVRFYPAVTLQDHVSDAVKLCEE